MFNSILSPTVIGVGLHRLGLKSIEVKLKSNEMDLSGVARCDPPQTPIKSIEAKLKLTEVARGEPALTLLKATESKFKFNEAQPS